MDTELNRQVSKLRQSGVMEPTSSPYSSPIFLVHKPSPQARPHKPEMEIIFALSRIIAPLTLSSASLPRTTKGRILYAQNRPIKSYAVQNF
jgi:hypothetical protein